MGLSPLENRIGRRDYTLQEQVSGLVEDLNDRGVMVHDRYSVEVRIDRWLGTYFERDAEYERMEKRLAAAEDLCLRQQRELNKMARSGHWIVPSPNGGLFELR